MNPIFIVFILAFFSIYGSLNYYIGLRFFQSFAPFLKPYAQVYWIAIALLALSPFVSRMVKRSADRYITDRIANLGDYWLAVFYYAVLLWVVVDVVRFISRTRAVPSVGLGAGVFIALALILAYGAWNARTPRITTYDITIDKQVEGLEGLRAVMVADIHLGTTINNRRLEDMVRRINALQPDIIFYAGDIIDGDVSEFAEEEMPRILNQLTPRLGSYAVLGNHEKMRGGADESARHLRESGITVLVDQYIKVNNQFYVVGRDDAGMHGRPGATSGMPLDKIMVGIDKSLPIILLDHQPSRIHESLENGVDLQFSGHTHYGQLFPNHLITGRIFEIDWGHLKKEALHVIVSCGFGTWGPPIRTSGYSEIVEINIRFTGK